MSSNSFTREICVTHLPYHLDLHQLLKYFEEFGTIDHYRLSKSTSSNGCLYIVYENRQCVDRCMLNRPHRLRGHYLYVKRSLPHNVEHPREHFDSVRDLIVTVDSQPADNEKFLRDLREYFSAYGLLYACKYCHETTNFNCILIEFADYDQVDQIILDRPHYLHHYQLNVIKSSSTRAFLDEIELDPSRFTEIELENEIQRLKQTIKQMNEDFLLQRKDFEDRCCEKLRKLNEKAEKTHRLQQDLEKEFSQLSIEYENLQKENQNLNDEFILAELENFEIHCFYDRIFAEEKNQLVQLESIYKENSIDVHTDDVLQSILDDDKGND